jgi:hypothetical protein
MAQCDQVPLLHLVDLPGPAISCIIQYHLGAKDKLALFQVRRHLLSLALH